MNNNPWIVGWFTDLLRATGSVELSILIIGALAIVLSLALHAAAMRVLLGAMNSAGVGRAILFRVRGLTRLAAILLGLLLVLPAIEFDPAVAEAVRRFLNIGMIALLGWSAILAIDSAAGWVEKRHRIDVDDNLTARRVHTQVRILRRIAIVTAVMLTVGAILVTFPAVQAYGVSLFASAGVAGLVLGLAARPILTNVIAGIQIALTQPIRIDDVVIVEGEWGWVEEITATYVVLRIWDLRRLIVPLSHFIEKPFENWTRESAEIVGVILWHLDYSAPIEDMRRQLEEQVKENPLWDGKVVNLQVVDSGPMTLTVRALVSARTSPRAWDLRCQVREAMLNWLRERHPDALPRIRAQGVDPLTSSKVGISIKGLEPS